MPSRSRVHVVAALCLLVLTALAACDDSGPAQRMERPGPDEGSPSGVRTKVRDCKVSVVLTGAVTKRLQGSGRAIYDNATGPQAFYQFSSGDTSVQVYSDGKNFTASVVVNTEQGSFTSEPGTKGLDVSTTGRSALVDSDTVGLDAGEQGVHVQAIYRCA